MWKAYAPEDGVMIKSTINCFTRAVDYTGYDLICLPMSYCGYWGVGTEETAMCKDRFYADERELRFYFDFDTDNQALADGDHIELPVNPKELISGVIISPFVDKDKVAEHRKELREKYNIIASYSSIVNHNTSMSANVNGHK